MTVSSHAGTPSRSEAGSPDRLAGGARSNLDVVMATDDASTDSDSNVIKRAAEEERGDENNVRAPLL